MKIQNYINNNISFNRITIIFHEISLFDQQQTKYSTNCKLLSLQKTTMHFSIKHNQIIIIKVLEKKIILMNKQTKFISGDRQLYERFTLKRQKVIGRGNSYVYEVEESDGNIECVKEVRLEDNMSQFIFRKQIQLLGKLKINPHPNIVQYRGSYCLQEKNQFKSRKGYIQMQKGIINLKQYLQHRKSKMNYFTQDQVLTFVSSMLDAFTHLQKIQLAHRDVKPSNILIFEQDPLFFKICDVGAGTAVGICDMTQNRTVIGTPYYLSPQLFTAYRSKHYLTNYKVYKSDCYSLGLVFLQFCSLKQIQERLVNEKEIIQESIMKIKKRYGNIVGLGKILRRMLDQSIKTRNDFIELQAYINENDLLRSKIDVDVILDPQIVKKLALSRELVIEKFEDLINLSKIISSGNKIPKVKINLTTACGELSSKQKQLIDSIKNIKYINLQELNLKMQLCEISEKQAQVIASGIFKNQSLRIVKLDLWNNKIKNQGFSKIMNAIQSIASIMQQLSIYVPNNGIRLNNSLEQLFNLAQFTNLTELQLNFGFNQMAPQFFQLMMKGISQAKNLRVLELTFQLSRLNHVYFNKGIKQLINCQGLNELTINVSDNSIRDEGLFGICDLLMKLPELKYLNLVLRNTDVGDKGFNQLMKSLVESKKLISLKVNLIGNCLTEKGVKLSSLQNIKSLESISLNLSNNKIGDLGIKSISVGLIGLSNIQKLKLILDGIQVTQKGCHYLGRLISQLPHLYNFDLSIRYNYILLKGVQCICTGLLSTKKLKKLKLIFEDTKIGDYAANYLATCLLKIRTLTSVDLNMENCDLGEGTMLNIMRLVRQCSKKAEQITISMRKNKALRMQVYQSIKNQLISNRAAIKIDQPNNSLQYSLTR